LIKAEHGHCNTPTTLRGTVESNEENGGDVDAAPGMDGNAGGTYLVTHYNGQLLVAMGSVAKGKYVKLTDGVQQNQVSAFHQFLEPAQRSNLRDLIGVSGLCQVPWFQSLFWRWPIIMGKDLSFA